MNELTAAILLVIALFIFNWLDKEAKRIKEEKEKRKRRLPQITKIK